MPCQHWRKVNIARKSRNIQVLKNGKKADEYQKKVDERFGKGDVCCPECGEKMTLIRIWSKARGVVYDKDGLSKVCPPSAAPQATREKTLSVVKDSGSVKLIEQLAFAF